MSLFFKINFIYLECIRLNVKEVEILATKLGTVADLKKKTCFEVEGRKIAVFKVNGKFYAIDSACTHKGGPLCEGGLDGKVVSCPWHASKFDVTTGKVMASPAEKDVASHKITVKGNDVFIELAGESKKKVNSRKS